MSDPYDTRMKELLEAVLSSPGALVTMRLRRVETGHHLPQKLTLGVMRVVIGPKPPDVVKTMLYRDHAG